MFKNYLKVAIRNLVKFKGYSFINLFGLAVGIACFMIIVLYIQDELSYDKFHKDADQIYRLAQDQTDSDISASVVPPAMGPALVREIPEIKSSTRIYQWGSLVISRGTKAFSEPADLSADSTFFDVFSFSFIRGEPKSALRDPSSVVITESMAKKYFGDQDPMGKTLTINSGVAEDYHVSAVIKDVPIQSHFRFDYVLAVHRLPWMKYANNIWRNVDPNAHTYIKLVANANVNEVIKKVQNLADANSADNNYIYSIHPLAGLNGIHLSSHRTRELQPNSDTLYIKALVLVALFVILIAGINYVNLATARAAMRAREIGIRKVVGAFRSTLVRQYLVESFLMALLAGILAMIVTNQTLPFFNSIMQKELSLFTQAGQTTWVIVAIAVTSIGLFAGLYPAFYLSSLQPVLVLKNKIASIKTGFSLRQGLVLLQFSLAILLIAGLLVVRQQLNYIQNANLGFDKEHVIMIPHIADALNQDIGSGFRNTLAKVPGVIKAGAGSELGTISGGWREKMRIPGLDRELIFTGMQIDYNYLDVLGIGLKEGRNFSAEFPADSAWLGTVILNETAVKQLGLSEPLVGQNIDIGPVDKPVRSKIIGVVNDFHFSSFHKQIDSFGFFWWKRANKIAVKLAADNIQDTIERLKKVWDQHVNGIPFDYYFLDKAIDQQYHFEENFRTIFSIMTGLCLLVACLGLFGLISFTSEQRTKEIGIRKVLGASIHSVIYLLLKDFLKLVAFANIIAWPLAWILMRHWLDNFAYRIDIGWTVFTLSGAIALIIALLTVSWQAIRAAVANPVESLRYE